MQVQLGDQFSNLPGPVDEQRQQPTLEHPLGVAHPWPPQLYRSRTQRQPPGSGVSVPVACVESESDLRADFALPRNSVTCSYSNSWISRWTGFSSNPPTAPPPAFDSDLLTVLPFPIGGVSPPLGLKPVLFTEGVHRLTVCTPFEVTSTTSPVCPTEPSFYSLPPRTMGH